MKASGPLGRYISRQLQTEMAEEDYVRFLGIQNEAIRSFAEVRRKILEIVVLVKDTKNSSRISYELEGISDLVIYPFGEGKRKI